MDQRTLKRISERAGHGAGSAYAEAQKVSRGLSDKEAEREAEKAKRIARGEETDDLEDDIEEEIPPPDLEPPTEEENEVAKKISEMIRADKTPRPKTYVDPIVQRMTEKREKIEADLDPISVSDLLFNQRAIQKVPLFDDVDMVLRSLLGLHFTLLDRWTLNEFDKLSMAVRSRLRQFTAVALTIHRLDGKIPAGVVLPDDKESSISASVLDPDPKLYYDVFDARLNWLQEKSPVLIDVLCAHVTWFEQRIRRVIADHMYVGQRIKKS